VKHLVVMQPYQQHRPTDILQQCGENFVLLSTFLSQASLSANVNREILRHLKFHFTNPEVFLWGDERSYSLGLVCDNFQPIPVPCNVLKWRTDSQED
jgi:hypothetical protein